MSIVGKHIYITGIVQGVGFRPFVYNLAQKLNLLGWVQNTSGGVNIQIEGQPERVDEFIQWLSSDAPPLAHIDHISVTPCDLGQFTTFNIIESAPIPGVFQPISPDISICPDCLRELFDPQDRRYHYPFINCTNCGPRFTIIEDIPYDRPNTSMAEFPLCPDCAREYHDPLDRRFHAQPVACPKCGPHIWLTYPQRSNAQPSSDLPNSAELTGEAALRKTQQLLRQGKIIAIKGLGGFHLACDATNQDAVAELRRRKLRVDKPFAVMLPDLATVESHCITNTSERQLLETRQRPIVILERRPGSSIADSVAPYQDSLGVMLPYTPLHYLLFANPTLDGSLFDTTPLVMTSGNLSEEPIASDNQYALQHLANIADAFLMHNRPIRTRCDDSVMRVLPASPNHVFPLRRSRGYAPFPIHLNQQVKPILAVGAELKNTFCITRDGYAFLSHHIGDLENYETLQSFEDGIQHLEKLFRIRPQAIAYDLHPNYLSTRYALQRAERENIPLVGVQHHHAHIASCITEHKLPPRQAVIGVAFDGTGYGDDGHIWGGEFLVADLFNYQRAYHITYAPLPGGETAIRKPYRIALAQLWRAGLDWSSELPAVKELSTHERAIISSQLEHQINTPLTSSMGRLFDAVAALVGVRTQVNYEAQAAIEFEILADHHETGIYSFEIAEPNGQNPGTIDPKPLICSVINDFRAGVPVPIISARFHNSISNMVCQICKTLRSRTDITVVALSGGVWQNMRLLNQTSRQLSKAGFTVLAHQQVPTNDGGIALGQAIIGVNKFDL
ncbi:MAG TPA: carbamoyltransferase HypF [Anaerolineales bacterium]|nr:carbamoyltransferase HypF [Anaerolineales bacterium]